MDERSEAIFLYLGFGPSYNHPKLSEGAVLERFGDDRGLDLLAYAKSIVAEMYDFTLPEYIRSEDPTGNYDGWLARTYRTWVAERHPELDPEAIRALGTGYAYWWR
jgi:hypothetical protein